MASEIDSSMSWFVHVMSVLLVLPVNRDTIPSILITTLGAIKRQKEIDD